MKCCIHEVMYRHKFKIFMSFKNACTTQSHRRFVYTEIWMSCSSSIACEFLSKPSQQVSHVSVHGPYCDIHHPVALSLCQADECNKFWAPSSWTNRVCHWKWVLPTPKKYQCTHLNGCMIDIWVFNARICSSIYLASVAIPKPAQLSSHWRRRRCVLRMVNSPAC